MNPSILIFWQRYGLTAMLGLAAVFSLGVIGFETGWGQAMRPPLPTANDVPRPSDMLATLPAFTLPALEGAFKETAERPLFSPTRRPAALNLAANVPAMKKGQFKLSGTAVNSDLTIAYLREVTSGKTVRVAKGKEINGMTLATVEVNRVVLKQGEETEELMLGTAPSPPAPAKVAPPPPGPAQALQPTPPAGAPPPVASVDASAPSQARPIPLPPNALVPAPGQAVLPGFVMPAGGAPAPTQVVPSSDPATTAQRRRRFQPTPQQ